MRERLGRVELLGDEALAVIDNLDAEDLERTCEKEPVVLVLPLFFLRCFLSLLCPSHIQSRTQEREHF